MGRISKQILLNCTQCNKEYSMAPSKATNSKFCNRACKDKNSTIHNSQANCLCCNESFIGVHHGMHFLASRTHHLRGSADCLASFTSESQPPSRASLKRVVALMPI